MKLNRSQLLISVIESAPQQDYDPDLHYISAQLVDKSRRKLLNSVPGHFPNTQGHHVTLIAKPTEDDIERFRRHVGKQVNFHATHHASDTKLGAQAVRVRGLERYSDKPHHHVTISTNQGVPAHASNEVLGQQKGERLKKWLSLTGRIDITPRTGRLQ